MLREEGNHDYRIVTEDDELYVRVGVDKLWVTSKRMKNKVLIFKTSLKTVISSNLPAIVERILIEFEDRRETCLDVQPHLLV